jgi:short-subunit dehydrogenase
MNTIITGASKGIGKAIALKFASQGHHLALCARNADDLDALKKEINIQYPDIKVFVKSVDISKPTEVQAFGADVLATFGEIDVLINNGGVFISGNVLEEADGVLAAQIETNLYSAYHLSREIVPVMILKGRGHVFNMCSIASQIAYPNGGSYTISKFALLGFSKVLREELKDKGIKVTSILPGATWSASWSGVDLPHERLMEAADIAETVWAAYALGPSAVVEEIVIRPQLGDL